MLAVIGNSQYKAYYIPLGQLMLFVSRRQQWRHNQGRKALPRYPVCPVVRLKRAIVAIEGDNAVALKRLLAAGLDPDAATDSDDKPKLLHIAAGENAVQVAELLLDAGANIDSIDGNRETTPLHYAANVDALEVSRLLVSRGAIVNFVDKFGNTPLHFACWRQSLSVAKVCCLWLRQIDVVYSC